MTGTGFVAGATVNFGTSPAITPSSITSTQIVATIPAADIAAAGSVNVTVTNPAGGGTSNAQSFTINNPAPTVTSLSPTSATAGGAAFPDGEWNRFCLHVGREIQRRHQDHHIRQRYAAHRVNHCR